MKRKFLFLTMLLTLCAVGTMKAQNLITVTTEAELIAAVQTNNAQIRFANNISTTRLLEIKDSDTITIDMNGFTLDRGCTSRGSQVIVVRTGSTLNLSNGTLTGGYGGNGGALDIETNTIVNLTDVIVTGNHAEDRGGGISNHGTLTMTRGSLTNNTCNDHTAPEGGGGIFNYGGATANLTNVTINGNTAEVKGGGGICNYGTMTLDSCTITGNSCKLNGGGIWQGASATLNLQGLVTVTDNTSDGGATNNLFLKTNAVITVTGGLTDSSIGVQMESNTGTFTSGYSSHNGYDPATIFTSDFPSVMSVSLVDNEAKMDFLSSFQYIECSWDDVNKQVVKTPRTLSRQIYWTDSPSSESDYKVVSGGSGELGIGGKTGNYPEFYLVRGTVNQDAIRVNGTDVHLVLCDGAKLNVNSVIVNAGYKLHIHSQSYGASIGKLNANNNGHDENAAAIGGEDGVHYPWVAGPGLISIHGGSIYAKGGDRAAGIGGGANALGGTIVIYDGHIRAYGGDGAGFDGSAGAGIGGGNLQAGANLTVYGGAVYAYGGPDAAGIGSGNCGNNGDYSIQHGGYFTMYGGYVEAHGGDNGAGIGGGEYSEGPRGVNIYGGIVKAYGGEDAAGIGSGYHYHKELSSGTINISGGEVHAWGKDEGAGIGGGENAKGANVTITGGIVEAHAGLNEEYYKAIGPGRDNDDYGTLELGDQMMVRYKIGNDWSEPVPANYPTYGRKAGAWYHTEARIEPCTHPGATYSDGGSSVSVGCSYCLTGTMPYTFHASGNWNDESKWLSSLMPHVGNDVAVKADATIPADCCAHVGDITIDGGSITIADGGQLIHNNASVTATVQKVITGHGGGNNGGWNFISSPISTTVNPNEAGLITDGKSNPNNLTYDFYYFDQTGGDNGKEWKNYRRSIFYLENGQGYLYANNETVELDFEGTLYNGNGVVPLDYTAGKPLSGWNLVGNPFACNATIDQPFYVIDGKNVVPNPGSTIIPPCTGVMVQATASGQSVTFTKTTEQQSTQPSQLQIMLSQTVEPVERLVVEPVETTTGVYCPATLRQAQGPALLDKAIVSFNESDKLEKFHFGNDAKVYIPQGGKDYAIAFSDRAGEMPLNFKATENGTYMITVNPEGVELAYLHLIDNMTGADVDLLAPEPVEGPASYTFTAKTTDYESRFKLVFSAQQGGEEVSDDFAFISNGNIIVNGTGTLQIIDVMGHVVRCTDGACTVSTAGMIPGVYVLRLINGNKLKTQKVVIK